MKYFQYNFLENRTMYFVENHMIVKHQCCTVRGNMFYFVILLSVILILIQVSNETASSTVRIHCIWPTGYSGYQ